MRTFVIAAAATAALLSAGAARADLSGQTVGVDLTDTAVGDFGAQSVLVGPGVDGNYFDNQLFDLNGGPKGDEFTVTSTQTFCGIDCDGGNIVWTLTGLNFGVPLLAFDILQSPAPVTIDSLTATSVTFQYADVALSPGAPYLVGEFVTTAGVPEPASWALLIGGFGLSGAMLRRRRALAAA
jgi:hypothetical protein